MLGVLTAIEVVDSLHRQGRRLKKAIEIVGFCDEEGTRFGITLLGSRGLTGTWPESWLAQTDADGVSVAQAMVLAGLDPARIHLTARSSVVFPLPDGPSSDTTSPRFSSIDTPLSTGLSP